MDNSCSLAVPVPCVVCHSISCWNVSAEMSPRNVIESPCNWFWKHELNLTSRVNPEAENRAPYTWICTYFSGIDSETGAKLNQRPSRVHGDGGDKVDLAPPHHQLQLDDWMTVSHSTLWQMSPWQVLCIRAQWCVCVHICVSCPCVKQIRDRQTENDREKKGKKRLWRHYLSW